MARTLKKAQSNLKSLTPDELSKLKKEWDLEHTYYSSALEWSMIEREDVERLSGAIK